MPSLYIVGTPIGNLEDLTFRAKNVLSEVGYIFSEDTRVTKKLLDRYDIKSKLISIYQPNKNLNTSSFINILETNDVAFVTDAGTPGISDPAGEFVKLARNNNHQIITIPGVSALTSAFSVSGFESKGLNFLGFLPKSLNQKINILNKAVELLFPIVIYESQKRIIKTLEFLLMLNPLLNLNLPLTLSAKIVSIFKSLPISYPITIPPIAGARIKSIFLSKDIWNLWFIYRVN